jgi:hypothetical protein
MGVAAPQFTAVEDDGVVEQAALLFRNRRQPRDELGEERDVHPVDLSQLRQLGLDVAVV